MAPTGDAASRQTTRPRPGPSLSANPVHLNPGGLPRHGLTWPHVAQKPFSHPAPAEFPLNSPSICCCPALQTPAGPEKMRRSVVDFPRQICFIFPIHSGRLGFFAGWIEPDYIFVELPGMRQVHLPLFKLGSLEQFLRLVPAAGSQDKNTTAPTFIHCLIVSPITLAGSAASVSRVAVVSPD